MYTYINGFILGNLPALLDGKSCLEILLVSNNPIGMSNGKLTEVATWPNVKITIHHDTPGSYYKNFIPELSEAFIAFVYLGYSIFHEAIHYIEHLKSRYPEAHIVAVTCDCQPKDRLIRLEMLQEQQMIGHIVTTDHLDCGGSASIHRLGMAAVDKWQHICSRSLIKA